MEEHAPYDVGGGQGWLLIGGFLIPALILAVVFVLGLRTMTAFPLHDGEHRKPEIRIIGRQWWWEVHYLGDSPHQRLVTANKIHIPTGRPVEFELESADVIHSFWIPKLHGKVDLVPGMRNRIRLQADQPGATPRSPEAVHGQELFVSRACGLCHTIRGTDALGGVGPDLTHLASRRGIAANSLPNDTAHLAAWMTHAQAFKPGAQMPNVTDFTGKELRALVSYLQQLR